jgi:methylamine---glutamate N-methyltransferase subunit B
VVDNRPETPVDVVLAVPEIRDYHAINSEIVRLLDAGRRTIRLSGVRGQRLLAAGLAGVWAAVIEVEGDAGPELAAGLDAPALTVICRGCAADGGASRLRAGRVLVLGDVGPAFGYALAGGLAVADGDAAGRAGLRQTGGELVLLGKTGPLAGEGQAGGRLFAFEDRIGPHAARGHRGGRFIRLARDGSSEGIAAEEAANRADLVGLLEPCRPWLGTALERIVIGPASSSRGEARQSP